MTTSEPMRTRFIELEQAENEAHEARRRSWKAQDLATDLRRMAARLTPEEAETLEAVARNYDAANADARAWATLWGDEVEAIEAWHEVVFAAETGLTLVSQAIADARYSEKWNAEAAFSEELRKANDGRRSEANRNAALANADAKRKEYYAISEQIDKENRERREVAARWDEWKAAAKFAETHEGYDRETAAAFLALANGQESRY